MPADTTPALPPQAAVQTLEDSANSAPPTVTLESHGYSYQIVGASALGSDQLRQILADANDPSVALLRINLALQQAHEERAELLQRNGNTVVFRISAHPAPKTQTKEGVNLASSPVLPEEELTNLPALGPGKQVRPQQSSQPTQPVAVVVPIVSVNSHGYAYEVVGQPLMPADKLRHVLAEAIDPSDAMLRLNQAIAKENLALAGARAEYSSGVVSRILLLKWLAAFEARANLEAPAQDTNDVNLKLSPAMNESILAQAHATRESDAKTVCFRLLKQPVATLDAPGQLKPFYSDVTDVNLTLSALLRDDALASAYSARQGERSRMNFTAIPGSEAVRMSVDEIPIPGAKAWNASVTLGNLGNRYAGRWQAGTSVAYRPGHGSEITANYTQGVPSLDSASAGTSYKSGGAGVSAVTPWGMYGINYSQTNYQAAKSTSQIPAVVNGVPQLVLLEQQQRGTVKSLALSGEQILHTTQNTRWSASEGLAYVDDAASVDVFYLGTFFPDAPLHDEKFTFVSAGVSLDSKAYVMGRAAALTGSVKLAQGLSGQAVASSLTTRLADPEFFLAQGDIGYEQTLPAELKFGVTLSTQWTANVLPQSRQLVIGGFGNLTAWLPGIASGDRGGQFRARLNSPAIEDGAGTFSLSLFYEAGRVATVNAASVSPTQSLSDAGIALVGDTPNLQYIFGYAQPLAANNSDQATRDLLRAHTFFNLTGKW